MINGEPVKTIRSRIFSAREALEKMILEDRKYDWQNQQ
jgi:DNA-directed RNA polymerase specialized sigma24 family protein